MKSVEKALWYIESHFREPLDLDTLAHIAGVSKFHLSRMFGYEIGVPISKYIRLRRLSTAAKALAEGERDILNLALSMGYGSHEAFSRAFKEHFLTTPESVRDQGYTTHLNLQEPKLMKSTPLAKLPEPRFVSFGPVTLVGTSRRYHYDKIAGIPEQWQSFGEALPTLSIDQRPETFGVIYQSDETGFDYFSGINRQRSSELSSQFVRLDLAAHNYVVFEHAGHVSSIRDTCSAIWSEWLPDAEVSLLDAPWFEKYGESFDAISGHGGVEIWMPVGEKGA